uniref:Uncharacterized protein n=1 Tax=Cyprinus carpio TaxID=7962 RepID=A0A8C2L2P7_CYPCA
MAASVSDSTQRPLQNAMKLVKVAIQLDTGNRHKRTFKGRDLPNVQCRKGCFGDVIGYRIQVTI